jgi:hypothetical protein
MERFTVVIPTLDRCETLVHTLETCVAQQDDHFQILVSDNLSTDRTRDVIDDFVRRDARISVIRPPKRLGMASHYEFALGHVTDGFVMLLGSDDGLLPQALPQARKCLQIHPEAKALHCGYRAQYFYPDYHHWPGSLQLRLIEPPRPIIPSARLLSVAMADEMPWSLPYPYNFAWVRASLFTAVKERTGRLIHSPIPDVFLSVAIASILEDHEMVPCPPITVLGLSSKSVGGNFTNPSGSDSIYNTLLEGNEVGFHPQIKYTRSVDLQVQDCLLRARDCGLLPDHMPFPWEKRIARSLVEIHETRWSEPQRQANLQALREQAAIIGCEHLMTQAAAFSSIDDWKKTLPFSLKWQDPDWDFVFDTRPMGVTGVHEAARLAGDLFAAMDEAESPRPVALAGSADIRSAAMAVLARSYGDARASWLDADREMRVQSDHAAHLKTLLSDLEANLVKTHTDLDQTKAKLAETKRKLADAKADIAQLKHTRKTPSWLQRWYKQ